MYWKRSCSWLRLTRRDLRNTWKRKKMRYKSHRNLLRWFLEDQRQLPAAYVASCERFFKELSDKRQATSYKQQATSGKLDKV